MAVKEDFGVGARVAIAHTKKLGPLVMFGLEGTVRMVHPDAGVCVALDLAPFFQPCSWFNWSQLVLMTEPRVLPYDEFERALGGRPTKMPESQLGTNLLRAWVWLRLRPQPEHPLTQLISRISYNSVRDMWAGETTFELWRTANDMRPRRVRILNREAAGFDSTIKPRRVR